MRRAIPIAGAIVTFLLAVALVQPEPGTAVVVASVDLSAGHAIVPGEVTLQEIPRRLAPTDGFHSFDEVLGQTLRVDRAAGDVIRRSHIGQPITLRPDERAVAVRVTDSAGLAGLLRPGDTVGVVAIIQVQEPGAEPGAFSKAVVEPLRVLYLSPEFAARDPLASPQVDPVTALSVTSDRRQTEGTVLLAVPTHARVVLYDFSGRHAPNSMVVVNAIELLTALDAAGDARVSLYLVPDGAQAFTSSGLFLPDLVITPAPTPTVTPTPEGLSPGARPGLSPGARPGLSPGARPGPSSGARPGWEPPTSTPTAIAP